MLQVVLGTFGIKYPAFNYHDTVIHSATRVVGVQALARGYRWHRIMQSTSNLGEIQRNSVLDEPLPLHPEGREVEH